MKKIKIKSEKNIFEISTIILIIGALIVIQSAKTQAASLECIPISETQTKTIGVSMWDFNPDTFNANSRGITKEEYDSKTEDEKSNIDNNLVLFGTSEGKVINGTQNGFIGINENTSCDGALQGILKNKLENGNVTLSDEYQNNVDFFPKNSESSCATNSFVGWQLQVLKEDSGFYSFDSNDYHLSKDYSSNTFKLHKGSRNGFYPMNSCEDDTSIKENRNNYFAAKFEIPFIMSEDGKMYNPDTSSFDDMVFNISGNDDIWVFADDDLIADLGGIHGEQSAQINFAENTVTYSMLYNKDADCDNENAVFDINAISKGSHILRVFYVARSGNETNLAFNYNLQNTGVEVKHIEKDTEKLLNNNYIIAPKGTVVTTQSDSNYDYCKITSPENEQITVEDELKTVNYYYEKPKILAVDYVDIVDNRKILESWQNPFFENDRYSAYPKDVPDYYCKEYSLNGVKMQSNTGITNTMENENIHIIFYYQYTKASATANYVDKDTGKILYTDERTGYELDETEFEPKKFEGYTIIESPDSNTQKFTKKGRTITYYYEKLGKITVNYINNATKKKIMDSEIKWGKNGEKVTIQPPKINGYGIHKSPSETEYTFDKNNNQIVNFYYLQQHNVIVNYINKTNNQIIYSMSKMYNEGKLFRSTAIPFKNYKLVKKPQNANFIVGKKDVTINYYYEKCKCNLSIDIKLDKVIVNNKYYELNGKIAKAEIPSYDANSSSPVIIYYIITIKNTGEISAKGKVSFDIPQGYELNPDDFNNSCWWTVENGKAYLKNYNRKGESNSYNISLKKISNDDITGTIRGNVNLEAYDLSNNLLEEDNNDDNTDFSDLVIAPRTGVKQKICFIAFLAIALVILIFAIDKKLGNNQNNNNDQSTKIKNNNKLIKIEKKLKNIILKIKNKSMNQIFRK